MLFWTDMMKSKITLSTLVGAVVLLLYSCYPLTITRAKWRIKWDKDMRAGKQAYLEEQPIDTLDQPPNIIIIMADDLGKYEVSAYGADHISTPYIDQLGTEGVRFTQGYVTAPTCAPSRAGIMTGRIQNRFGFETQIMEHYPTNMIEYLSGKYIADTDDMVLKAKPDFPSEWQVHKQGIPPTEIHLTEALKKYGYKTGITGKWHLGKSNKHLPMARGFDYQYGFYGAFSWYTPQKVMSKIINYEHQSFSAQHQWKSGRYGDGAIRENGKTVEEDQYLTFAIRDKAINFIEQHKEDPFFLYCTFSAPHIPFQAPVDYYCRYSHIEDDNKRVYYAMISALDDAVGAIHDRLKELGLEENTLIFFLSDNGGASYTKATNNGPLKGGKLTQFEGGINVPFLMKWKGKIPEGLVYEHPVLATDIFTTALLNAGGELPTDRAYDGVDLMPFLTKEKEGQPHDQLFWRCDHIWAVRDGAYKLILSTRDGWAELYNIEKDQSESYNLKAEMPDLYQRLLELHQDWQLENLPDKPLWPRIMDHRFIIEGKEYLFPA